MSRASGHTPSLPPIDEQLIAPERGYELFAGTLIAVPPALEPHARPHARLCALLEVAVAPGYTVAADMLTRAAEDSDFAPDVSVYAQARDPATGGRRVDELVFEVVNTEALAHCAQRAAMLSKRGVRRIFAVDVTRRALLEWSGATGAWSILARDGRLEDAVLAQPLAVATLVDTARADDAIAAALLARGNPVLDDALQRERAETKADAVVQLLTLRGLAPATAWVTRLRAIRDEARLDALFAQALSCGAPTELDLGS